MFTVRLVRTAAHWRNAVAFSWAESGRTVKRVELERQGDVAVFRCGDREVSLDWTSGETVDTETR